MDTVREGARTWRNGLTAFITMVIIGVVIRDATPPLVSATAGAP
jgi:hypothetical protein